MSARLRRLASLGFRFIHSKIVEWFRFRPDQAWYCSSVTFSIQSALLPSSTSTMAMWVMAVAGAAPTDTRTKESEG
jgi:hypothetical protein